MVSATASIGTCLEHFHLPYSHFSLAVLLARAIRREYRHHMRTNLARVVVCANLYSIFKYLKKYCLVDDVATVLETPLDAVLGRHMSRKYWMYECLPMVKDLSELMDFIRWESRLAEDNHCPLFPTKVGITSLTMHSLTSIHPSLFSLIYLILSYLMHPKLQRFLSYRFLSYRFLSYQVGAPRCLTQ